MQKDYTEDMDAGRNKKHNLSKRFKKLCEMFDHPDQKNKKAVKIKLWRKYKKEKKGVFFEREGNMTFKDTDNHNFFFLDEFIKFPINPITFFKVSLAAEFAFKALHEYSVAFYFRNIVLDQIIKEKIDKALNERHFHFEAYPNIIIENA